MTTKVTAALIDNTGLDVPTVGGLAPVAIAAPIGSIIMWPLDTPHADYYHMDGSAKNRTTDAALFAVIGTTYGVGDGTTTFNLPDYRGQFPRGVDNAAGVDPDAGARTDRGDGTTGDVVGSKQAEEVLAHGHNTTKNSYEGGAGGTALGPGWSAENTTVGSNITFTSANTGGNETRPTNIGTLFCIKYK